MNKWIRCSEQLPEMSEQALNGYSESKPVLLLLPENDMTIGKYIRESSGEEYWINDIGGFI